MGQRRPLIYGLFDPRDGQLRYVGKSTKGLERCASHVCPSSLRDRTKKNGWIKSLLKRGLKPEAVELETVSAPLLLDEAERFWIASMRSIGCDLTNMTDGGDGQIGLPCPPERREKIAAAQRGKSRPPWSAERRSKPHPMLGRKMPPEAVTKTAAALRGRKLPPDQVAAMPEIQRAVWARPGHAARMSRAHGSRPFVDHLERRYDTVLGAARELGIGSGRIIAVLKGRRPFVSGFTFRYLVEAT